jgi:hypothetical protein
VRDSGQVLVNFSSYEACGRAQLDKAMGELGAGSGQKLAHSLLLTVVSSITYVTEWARFAD